MKGQLVLHAIHRQSLTWMRLFINKIALQHPIIARPVIPFFQQ